MAQKAYDYPNDGGTLVWNDALAGYVPAGVYTPFPDARGPIEGYPVNQPGADRVVFAQIKARNRCAIFIEQPRG